MTERQLKTFYCKRRELEEAKAALEKFGCHILNVIDAIDLLHGYVQGRLNNEVIESAVFSKMLAKLLSNPEAICIIFDYDPNSPLLSRSS